MKNYKIVLFIFSFIFSAFISDSAFADVIEDGCAQSTGYTPGMPNTIPNAGVIAAYNHCVSEARRMQTEQQNAPPAPGPAPVYNCTGRSGSELTQCRALYDAAMASYRAQVELYNQYLANHPNMNTAQAFSATEVLEDVAAKQQAAADKLKKTSQYLMITGTALIAIGTALVATGFGAAAGWAMIAAGGILVVFSMVTNSKANRLLQDKITACEQYNKIATKPIDCPNAQQIGSSGDGTIRISTSTNGNNIPDFIDPVTGLCRPGAPVECTTITKNLPAGCFQKNGACMAGGKTPVTITTKDGKVTMNLNGKQRTFGLDDFQSEASMVAAGFTPSQAKQFFSDMQNENGILSKNGLNPKGDLKGSITSSALSSGSGPVSSSSGTPAVESKLQKDEYSPAADAREPASAEGLVKDYHGDTIGVDRDDLFKMINRRYILKTHQNIFIGD